MYGDTVAGVLAMLISLSNWIAGIAIPVLLAGYWMLEHWIIPAALYYFFILNLGMYLAIETALRTVVWANKASNRLFG